MTLAASLAASVPGRAGDWHVGASLRCSDCHTMHNSKGGTPMRYDNKQVGSPRLLRSADALSLCEYCHDGSVPAAPDVVAPLYDVYAGLEPAGGWFASPGALSSPTGHDLGLGPQDTPYGTTKISLDCVTCHDPHGSGNHRNLRPSPSGRSPGTTVVVDQKVRPNGSNPAQAYATTNLAYRSGMSAWCKDCHDQAGADHADEAQIWGAASASYSVWQQPITNRVPVTNPLDPTVPSQDDQVFCLSCHKAHGSANTRGLIYADGATLDSTCAQCHQ
jgi:predicted CXXCH cytochrome family protein